MGDLRWTTGSVGLQHQPMPFFVRLATNSDLLAITSIVERAIVDLQVDFLSPTQIAASRAVMGVDGQLIADRTYWVAVDGPHVVGCGGWSRRATLYGGDAAATLRDPAMLDPHRDPARIRAMYTHPDWARQGVGRLILGACENAARQSGFSRARMMATIAGEPLYRACGYQVVERVANIGATAIAVPGVVMEKAL